MDPLKIERLGLELQRIDSDIAVGEVECSIHSGSTIQPHEI
jgi:hypothetical protein